MAAHQGDWDGYNLLEEVLKSSRGLTPRSRTAGLGLGSPVQIAQAFQVVDEVSQHHPAVRAYLTPAPQTVAADLVHQAREHMLHAYANLGVLSVQELLGVAQRLAGRRPVGDAAVVPAIGQERLDGRGTVGLFGVYGSPVGRRHHQLAEHL